MTLNRTIAKTSLALLAWLMAFVSASAASVGQNQPGILDLVRKYAAQRLAAANPPLGARVLHFPADRSLGRIDIQDVHLKRQIKGFIYWDDGYWNANAEYVGDAQGDVIIPAGKNVALTVNTTHMRLRIYRRY